jgi:hypothetical protein
MTTTAHTPRREEIEAFIRALKTRAAQEAPALPEATVQPTNYVVSCLPDGHFERHLFTLNVAYRGEGRWAVLSRGQCLATDGTWDHEMRPSEREDEWIAAHRFDLDTALRLAKEQAPLLTVNAHTVTDVLRLAEQRGDTAAASSSGSDAGAREDGAK